MKITATFCTKIGDLGNVLSSTYLIAPEAFGALRFDPLDYTLEKMAKALIAEAHEHPDARLATHPEDQDG